MVKIVSISFIFSKFIKTFYSKLSNWKLKLTQQNGQANMAPAQRVVAQPGQQVQVQGSPIAQGNQ